MAGTHDPSEGDATKEIKRLIMQARDWREEHRKAGRQVEMLACNIRINALADALAVVIKRNAT